ncbi:MerR family transcriptional regulator [Salmonella enterica subsp. enterica serovar Javiana]|nr:MerR family transcriptional regulator [Salmonella enterica subsp. enterica serovar Javiana]
MNTAPDPKFTVGHIRTVTAGPGHRSGDTAFTTIGWPIGTVAKMLGIPTGTLRTWERRYGLGPSERTQGGHRRYTDLDVARVQVMQGLVAEGASVSSAARIALSMDEVRLGLEVGTSQW